MIHAAGVVLVRKDGAVLMQLRADNPKIPWPNHWAYPAGHVEKDEDAESAARRELLEETGYQAAELSFLLEEELEHSEIGTITRHVYWTMYDDVQEVQCYEGKEVCFLKLDELEGKLLFPGNDRICALAIEQAKSLGLITTF